MIENKLNPDRMYGIFSLWKNDISDDTEDIYSYLKDDAKTIYAEELEKLYKFVLEFRNEEEYRERSLKYNKKNISIGVPVDDNISSIDRVVEYLESVGEYRGKSIRIIKDVYELMG